MTRMAEVREWFRFLETPTAMEGSSELLRLTKHLDEAFDEINYVLKRLSGCPGGEIEEILLVIRVAVVEAIDSLEEVIGQMRRGDPDAA